MPSDTSQLLGLPYIQPAQAQKHVTHNEALRQLDVIVQLSVASQSTATPPGAASAGDRYIVPAGASGDWADEAGSIAVYENTVWVFHVPRTGWHAYVADEGIHVTFDGAGWTTGGISGGAVQNVSLLGVGTTAATPDKLSVAAAATLLSHEGGDHRLKINKAAAGDTASLLFQTGFTGHAEMGLTGSNGFDIRVSPDGASFTTAMDVDPATAVPAMPQGLAVTGALTGSGVVGTVSHSGGISAGAVMETGETADGRYVRFADGTQICTRTIDLTYTSALRLTAAWTYPIAFKPGAGVAVSMSVLNEFDVTPGPEDLGWMGGRVGSGDPETGVSLRLYRRNGGVDFTSGDVMTVYAQAIGRWR